MLMSYGLDGYGFNMILESSTKASNFVLFQSCFGNSKFFEFPSEF